MARMMAETGGYSQQWGAQRVTCLTFQLVEGITRVTARKK